MAARAVPVPGRVSRRAGPGDARLLRRLGAVVVAALLCPVWSVPAASADGDGGGYTSGHVEGNDAVIEGTKQHDGSGGNGGDHATPVDTGGDTEPQPWKEHRYVPACSFNGPERGGDVMCGVAANSCPEDRDIRYQHWWRWVYPDGHKDGWQFAGTECRGPDEPKETEPAITPETVVDQARASAPDSEVHVQPEGRTYVNVPTNFYADGDAVTVPVSVFGNPIPVRFAPSSFEWDFGDGGTGTGPGVADAEVGQDGAVEHAYERSGEFGVTLTRTFTISFTLPDGSTHTVPGEVSSTSAPYPLQVGEVQSVVQDVG